MSRRTPEIILGFHGTSDQDASVQKVLRHLESGLIKGVILFKYNIESSDQLKALTTSIYNARPDAFISVDQEGGKVQRLRFNDYPSAREIAQQTPVQAFATYKEMAQELKDHGINYNFGPVVDFDLGCPVISDLDRSYGLRTAVMDYASAFVKAHSNLGIQTALKHFPGHGSAQDDTHLGWVDVTEVLNPEEYYIYKVMVDELKAEKTPPHVMLSHVVDQNLDPEYPMSLSLFPRGFFEGQDVKLISDDFHMASILENFTLEQVVTRAQEAELDYMIFSNNPAASGGNLNVDEDLPIKIKEMMAA